jgi:pyrroloquinoline quinone (PQQ) biosynthesis protein C
MLRATHPEIPYVKGTVDGSLSQHDFVQTQVQFFFAVEAYPHFLSVLAARSKAPGARKVLEENVRDEQGEGQSAQSHAATFRALLSKLGVTPAETDGTPRWPCVDEFNAGVREACTNTPEESGLATVAAIEDLFTTISRDLGNAIVNRGWLAREEVVHYNVHQKLDRVHADALYRELEAANNTGASQNIEKGLKTGVALMTNLYAGLLKGR